MEGATKLVRDDLEALGDLEEGVIELTDLDELSVAGLATTGAP